ncbi:putative hexosyltransferase [Escherichia coli DEC12A]|nr:putative hexosyltransferase [Escherichia coli DEC12A]
MIVILLVWYGFYLETSIQNYQAKDIFDTKNKIFFNKSFLR